MYVLFIIRINRNIYNYIFDMITTLQEIEFYLVEWVTDEDRPPFDDDEMHTKKQITKDWLMFDWNEVSFIERNTEEDTIGTQITFKCGSSIIATADYEEMKASWRKVKDLIFHPLN